MLLRSENCHQSVTPTVLLTCNFLIWSLLKINCLPLLTHCMKVPSHKHIIPIHTLECVGIILVTTY